MQEVRLNRLLLMFLFVLLVFFSTTVVWAQPVEEISIPEPRAAKLHIPDPPPEPPTLIEQIDLYVEEIACEYDVDPALIKSIIWHESRYNPSAKNGNCLGLMQVSTRWHSKRAAELGVTDFYNPFENVHIGVDYFSSLLHKYKDPALALMAYNMGPSAAVKKYKAGEISNYAKSVLAKAKHI